jgi:hypothetical protein
MSDNLNTEHIDGNTNINLESSTDLEGIENIILTKVNREINVTSYGLLIIEDLLEVKNLNNNPISSIFIGIPVDLADELVFFEATGISQNTMFTERSDLVIKDIAIITIYFNSPLLPHQSKTIEFNHIYRNIISYNFVEEQVVSLELTVFPLLPYKLEGDIFTIVWCPSTASDINAGWGFVITDVNRISYLFDDIKNEIGADFITPFLENLGDKKLDFIFFQENTDTKIEMKEIKREIFISSWGIIKVKEEFSIENLGEIESSSFSLKIPKHASNLYISDNLGEILGVTINSLGTSEYKEVTINLIDSRMLLTPNSQFNFEVEYNLPFDNYVSLNWFQISVQIDLLTTVYSYLGKDQTISVKIDSCNNINSITEDPVAIKKSKGTTILVYTSDFVSPTERAIIQFTFTVDLFDMLLRPIMLILIIIVAASAFVLLINKRKYDYDKDAEMREFIPINEIREFCSLFEEKNALTLEIRQAEEDTKRKKMAKKKYKSIINKNTLKIDAIQQELIPFRKVILETNETIENIVKRMDVLEAERISIKDSLNLLESRYKRGRLPSRAAFIKLSDDFKKRRKKIDRTIDKFLQQLRSYLI